MSRQGHDTAGTSMERGRERHARARFGLGRNESLQPVQAILFDKDGTLFDFRRTWVPIIREAALRIAGGNRTLAKRLLIAAGYDPDTDHFAPDGPIAAGTSDDIAASWAALIPAGLIPVEAAAPGEGAAERLRASLDRNSLSLGPANSVPVCDLPRLLLTLRGAGLRLGLATSDTESAARATLRRFEITECFDWISGYDSGAGRKPSPEIVNHFGHAVIAEPRSILVVGDTLHDLYMARSAGAVAVGVLTGAVEREVLAPHADVILDSIADLPDLLGVGTGMPPSLRLSPRRSTS